MTKSTDPLIQEVLNRRTIACLATHNDDASIHLTAVWFLYENGCIYIATQSHSRKARNLLVRPNVSLMVDVRDPGAERGVAVAGMATILSGARAAEVVARVQGRYLSAAALADPRVGPVFAKLDDVAIELVPEKWTSWDMRVLGQALFGGALATPGYFLALD